MAATATRSAPSAMAAEELILARSTIPSSASTATAPNNPPTPKAATAWPKRRALEMKYLSQENGTEVDKRCTEQTCDKYVKQRIAKLWLSADCEDLFHRGGAGFHFETGDSPCGPGV